MYNNYIACANIPYLVVVCGVLTDGGDGCGSVTDGGDGCDVVTDGGDGCGLVTDGGDGCCVVTGGSDGCGVVTDGSDGLSRIYPRHPSHELPQFSIHLPFLVESPSIDGYSLDITSRKCTIEIT